MAVHRNLDDQVVAMAAQQMTDDACIEEVAEVADTIAVDRAVHLVH